MITDKERAQQVLKIYTDGGTIIGDEGLIAKAYLNVLEELENEKIHNEHLEKVITSQVYEIERLSEWLNIREPLRWFAEQMEQTLKANDHKGGWKDLNEWCLYGRLREETIELERSLHGARHSSTELYAVIVEATDVANFAMMIADNARRALKGGEH